MEKIVAAAIRHPDGTVYSVPRPARHHNVIWKMHQLGVNGENGEHCCDQGFMTDSGRYVGREEASKIALGAGQIKEPASSILFSEDVW